MKITSSIRAAFSRVVFFSSSIVDFTMSILVSDVRLSGASTTSSLRKDEANGITWDFSSMVVEPMGTVSQMFMSWQRVTEESLAGNDNDLHLDVRVGIGKDSHPDWENIRMAPASDPGCVKPKQSRTKMMVLERGLYRNRPATKLLNSGCSIPALT